MGQTRSHRIPLFRTRDEYHRFDNVDFGRKCDGDGFDWDEHYCGVFPCEFDLNQVFAGEPVLKHFTVQIPIGVAV